MSFLAPLFLAATLAVALPVLFHLVRQTTRERTPFSSLMFLRPAPPRLSRRNRLEHLLLLLLRCAVITLLALAFARPFFSHTSASPPPAHAARRLILLVDASASLQRGQLWNLARERAQSLLRAAHPADHVAVFTFDRQLTPLITFEQWHTNPPADRVALARTRLAALTPGWAGTRLDLALIQAADLLAEPAAAPGTDARRQIVVVSDFQSGSRLDRLQAHEWPQGIEILLEPLPAPSTSNAAIHLAAEAADAPLTAETSVRLRLANEPDSRQDQFTLGWTTASPGFLGQTLTPYVPPGQHRLLSLPAAPTDSPADRLVLTGDDEPFDNTLFLLPPQPAQATVLYLGPHAAEDPRAPRFFLEHAFQHTRHLQIHTLAFPPHQAPPPEALQSASLLVLTDPLPPHVLSSLEPHLRHGATLLLAPTSADAVTALAPLPELSPLTATETTFPTYGLLGELDFRHPLFAPFADPRFSDFTRVHFWKARRLHTDSLPEARVLARFDDDSPALVEIPVGRGRVLVLASGWHPADSQFALSSKFVPWLFSLLEYSGVRAAPPASLIVGDPLPLDPDPSAPAPALVTTPDNQSIPLPAGQTAFSLTTHPGIYTVQTGTRTRRFAVNLDPAESRTYPLALDELERLGVPLAQGQLSPPLPPRQAAHLQNAEIEGRQKLWRWLLLATLLVLAGETWLAGRTARRPPAPQPVTP